MDYLHDRSIIAFKYRGKGSYLVPDARLPDDRDGFVDPLIRVPVLYNGNNLYRCIDEFMMHSAGIEL